MERAAGRLAAAGHGARVVLESTKPGRGEKTVLGYYSWGAADPKNRLRSVGVGFTPGAIAAHMASFDARTFREPPAEWRPTFSTNKAEWFAGTADALIGDVIRDGVTGVAGQVDEAYAFAAVRPEVLFPAYLSGFNLAEAFYLAVPTLSWQTVVIGDPLCAPFGRTPLARDKLEDTIDATTGYPGLFSKRRLAVVLTTNRAVPETVSIALLRAQAFVDRDDRASARRVLEEVVTLAPTSVPPLLALAQLDEEAAEYDGAIARYRRTLDLQPDHVVALNNLAYTLAIRRNAPAEALPFAQRAAQAAPKSGEILDTLGWTYHLLGSNELALKVLAEAVRLRPASTEIRLHAAVAYEAAGDRERAGAEVKEVIRLDPQLEQRDDVRQLQERLRP
jgi:Flp pilus assembly protein TadD